MSSIGALIKKELREQVKTYKLLVVSGIFVLFGLGTPLEFYYLPQILKLSGETNINIELPSFTTVDVIKGYTQTFTQLGLLVTILIGMGSIARERERGTAAMTLCKPVGRGSFVIAKILGLSATFLISLAIAGLACYGYTILLFGPVKGLGFLILNLFLGLFLLVCLSVTLFCSSLFRNQIVAGGLALVLLIGQSVVLGLPLFKRYSPNSIVHWGLELISGTASPAWPGVAVSLGIVLLCLILSWRVLERKDI